jgi:hypothetical protein
MQCVEAISVSINLEDCLYKCVENIPYKAARTNSLPDDEHKMSETCRRQEELN